MIDPDQEKQMRVIEERSTDVGCAGRNADTDEAPGEDASDPATRPMQPLRHQSLKAITHLHRSEHKIIAGNEIHLKDCHLEVNVKSGERRFHIA